MSALNVLLLDVEYCLTTTKLLLRSKASIISELTDWFAVIWLQLHNTDLVAGNSWNHLILSSTTHNHKNCFSSATLPVQ